MLKMTSHIKERNILLFLTTEIVSSYIVKNMIQSSDMFSVIESVYSGLNLSKLSSQKSVPIQEPAVAIKKSITPDYLICLEDGKKMKMLKRHLRTSFGMTPEQYRAKWGLPADYPMAAPNYTLGRSEFAKKTGFGSKMGRGRGAHSKR